MEDLITTSQLAKRLSVTTQTIYNWRKSGVPCTTIGKNRYRYDFEKVLKWLEEQNNSKGE